MDRLWYKRPAGNWNQALPIGNGRLGAMLFGCPGEDIAMLNEDTLWSGYPKDTNNYEASTYFKRAAHLAASGRYREAQDVIEEHMLGGWGEMYLPAGDLLVKSAVSGYTEYTRSLDLHNAVHTVRFLSDGVLFQRESFVSAPDQILCMSYRGTAPGSLTFTVTLRGQLKPRVEAEGNTVILSGEAPGTGVPSYIDAEEHLCYSDMDCRRGMTYCIMATVEQSGGTLRCENGELHIEGADSAEIRLAVNTSFGGYNHHPFLQGRNPETLCRKQLEEASQYGFEELKARHIADYRRLYDKVTLDLGPGRDDLPTDERLKLFSEKQDDNGLQALLFHYGRYLLIASSRPGTEPANLQGIWNGELCAPWSSNYTVNINTQMNYWPAMPCGLEECAEPLYRMIDELRATGRETARAHYGARGFCAHHNVDLWRLSAPVGHWGRNTAIFSFYPFGGAWLTRHLWEHYEYTLDKDFLQNRAYPAIRDSALFCDDMLCQMADGSLAVSPATSPENTFYSGGEVCHVAASSAHIQAIVWDSFRIFLKSSHLLGLDSEFAGHIRARLERLRGFEIGSRGQLLEWNEEFEETDPHHRHTSHLYALHPADIISAEDTPELAEASRRTLELRGDDGTGWSLGWKINFWARLRDGNHAEKLLSRQLRLVDTTEVLVLGGGTYANLLDAHPPFQIDGNFGAVAGIAEMLLQSREGIVLVLPALPDKWQKGSVSGLRAKGGLSVDIAWEDGTLRQVGLTALSPVNTAFTLQYRESSIQVQMNPRERAEFDGGLNRLN